MSVALFVVVDNATNKVMQTGSTDPAAIVAMVANPPAGRTVIAVTAANAPKLGDAAPTPTPSVP